MKKIRKAIVPVAGFGTRLYPLTKGIKKSFIPIFENNIAKPVILKVVEELDEAGIEEICLIIEKNEKELYENFFNKELTKEHYDKLNDRAKEYEKKIKKLGKKICYAIQEEILGFGHAVYASKEFARGEPVILILGDTIYKSNTNKNSAKQVIECYENVQQPIIALHKLDYNEIKNYGIVKGNWVNDKYVKCVEIVEKTTIEYAKENLLIDNELYGTFGQWIVTNEIYDSLEYLIKNKILSKGEYQLNDAYGIYMKNNEVIGYKVDGISYDVGNMQSYQKNFNIL